MTSIPYGIRDIKLTPFTDAAGTILAATSVKLPNAQTLGFSEVEDFKELRGDDRVVAQHGSGPTVEFDMESGGLPFEAYKAMAGGTIVESGTTGNTRKVYSKKSTDQRPWFRIEGQAISDSGGDLHTVIYKCKCTGDLAGEFKDGEFFLTSASGVGIGDVDDNLYDFVENEQITAFVEPNPGDVVATISGATPSNAVEASTILLKGAHFTGTTGITIGGVAATEVLVHSDDEITFTVPAGAAGAAEIIVTNATGASDPFTYTRGA